MIDPNFVTNFNRTEEEKEEYLIFCILVAGKKATVQARKLEEFLTESRKQSISPFQWIKNKIEKGYNELLITVMEHKLGQYDRIMGAFKGIIELQGKLSTCTVEDLEAIKGIGPKTSRFFILHTRPNQKLAVLDTHVLSHMKEDLGIETPKSTPNGKVYARLEQQLLEHIDKSGMSHADYDLYVWRKRSNDGIN